MKMVGVNVAADPLLSCAYSGVNGGLVVVSADDPSLHSSQNEQDNRHYAPFARIPMLEPSDSQESHDMMREAFVVSETFDAPVLFRMTTRVCHSRSLATIGERTEVPLRPYVKNAKFDLVPAVAYRLRRELEGKLRKLAEFSEICPFNRVEWHDTAIGIVTSGIAYQYAREVFGEGASYLKLGFTYPLPREKIAAFAAKVDRLYVIEELDPYLENQIRELGIACIGKEKIPRMYELNPEIIAEALLGAGNPTIACETAVPPRPPVLCAGCPHRGFFVQLGRAARRKRAKRQKFLLAGDIGCYALGAAEPLNAEETCICMGAAPSVGHGAQKIFDKFGTNTRVIAMLGDSTFFHTGIGSLMDIAYNKSNTITCILDNRATGMTGQQENPHTGFTLQGAPTTELSIEAVARAVGIDHVRVVNPMNLAEVDDALEEAIRRDAPAVIITRWPCVLKRQTDAERAEFRALHGRGGALQRLRPLPQRRLPGHRRRQGDRQGDRQGQDRFGFLQRLRGLRAGLQLRRHCRRGVRRCPQSHP
jgi:indolepyruvate ferredoxin oxidoreductase alpha subunit